MSLSLALNTALSGLSVNQRALSVLSQNIANANNPEYSRKIMTQQALYLQGNGAGVNITDITRKVDSYLQKSVRNQGSDYGRASVLADYTERLQVLLGKPGSQDSVYSDVTGFFNALQQLSQTPENAALRVGVVEAGRSLSQQMNALANGIHEMQYSIDQEISQSITAVNGALKEIYILNGTIAADRLLGRPVSELQDRRDSLVKDVATHLDIQTYEQTTGVMNLFTGGGYNLVDDSVYGLSYSGGTSPDFFANENATSAVTIYRLDSDGNKVGSPNTLVSSGVADEVTTALSSGKIKGLLDLRDKQLPDVLEKLDLLSATLRDEINALHNGGIAFPGASDYTGTREISAEDYSQWTGQVRIAILNQNGKPVPSVYSDETSGARPLLLDLEHLDTGNGEGYPSVQGIIDEINRNYGVPQNKVTLGPLNDVRLVLNDSSIPGSTPRLKFDFQIENISGDDADVYVTDVSVFDEDDNDITNLTEDAPTIALASTGTYTTTAGSTTVTVTTSEAHSLNAGDRVYLTAPGSAVDGLSASALSGFFIISNVTSTGFDIDVNGTATAGGSFDRSDVEARDVYYTAETGTNARSKDSGTITASLVGHTTSDYYTVKANISVVDADGTISSSQITYRIDNQSFNTKNYRYAARAATGSGDIVAPNSITPLLKAQLVDVNGNELPIFNNQYTTAQTGYLKLSSGHSDYYVAIDSLDSSEQGKPTAVPAVEGSERGFAHYFELNNFFITNRSGDDVVDAVKDSARGMAVSSVLTGNVNRIAIGGMTQSSAPVDPDAAPLYTYERHFGDNTTIVALSNLSTSIVSFASAGDLGVSQQTLSSYAGQLISTVSTKASGNKTDMDTSKLLLDGFNERSDSLRGVNLDEELANTVIYQNAYTASARVITVANEFFDALVDILR